MYSKSFYAGYMNKIAAEPATDYERKLLTKQKNMEFNTNDRYRTKWELGDLTRKHYFDALKKFADTEETKYYNKHYILPQWGVERNINDPLEGMSFTEQVYRKFPTYVPRNHASRDGFSRNHPSREGYDDPTPGDKLLKSTYNPYTTNNGEQFLDYIQFSPANLISAGSLEDSDQNKWKNDINDIRRAITQEKYIRGNEREYRDKLKEQTSTEDKLRGTDARAEYLKKIKALQEATKNENDTSTVQ